ncbi:hypothetical protein [Roseibium salinum]|uniref:Uncharacterized protein n=1 Tax=Roseibium salinum TaxID=1604349 RepID=A0ABT3R0N3_9HYPH|nr:hypothetical protein [Roseibium sp. DSM 29163]MCX2722660.1 hypothetical protein [Roseibium sp. DSM 29163]
MSVQRMALAVGAFFLAGATSFAGGDLPKDGDTYIISRDSNHGFRGSHQIYDRMSDGLIAVEYCGRSYWVRYATIAWTQLETERDYAVRVEFNRGKGWRPICENPARQVSLQNLGITDDPRIVAHSDSISSQRVNRFAVIRKAFEPIAREPAIPTYHDGQP